MSPVLRLVVMLAGVAGVVGCGGQQEAQEPQVMLSEMSTQGQHWEQAAPTRYEIAVQYDCFCTDVHVRSVVDGGNVVDVAPAGAQPVTVDWLLAQAKAMLARGYASASVEYDATFGYPDRFAIDPDLNLIDDEWRFHVTCFATGDAHCPAEPAGVSAP